MNINWIDGKDASGKYIIEVVYASGTRSYMKNESYETICYYQDIFVTCPGVVGTNIFSPNGDKIKIAA